MTRKTASAVTVAQPATATQDPRLRDPRSTPPPPAKMGAEQDTGGARAKPAAEPPFTPSPSRSRQASEATPSPYAAGRTEHSVPQPLPDDPHTISKGHSVQRTKMETTLRDVNKLVVAHEEDPLLQPIREDREMGQEEKRDIFSHERQLL